MLLKFLRKRKNMKRIMWALAILIIPAFIIWGAGSASRNKGKGKGYAGKVFDRKVSFDEYINMWRVSRDYAVRVFGANASPELIDQLTWNRILLLEKARRENISVKNSEVVQKIISIPAFQRNGVFDKKLYKSILGDAAKGFEEKLRDDIMISKLREEVVSKVTVTEEEVKTAYKNRFEKIKASYASIPFSDFKKGIIYTKADLSEYYIANKETFRKPESIKIRYIEIPFSRFEKDISISDESIKKYFEEHLSEFKSPDSEQIPELNDRIKKEISDKLSTDKKHSLAEELSYKVLDAVIEKGNLNDAARSFGLEVKETGFFNMYQKVPGIGWSYEFINTGFQLKKHEISKKLIKTGRGFYIIQLEERKNSYIPEFNEAKKDVIESYIKDESIRLAKKYTLKIYARIKNKLKSGATFEEATQKLGLTLHQTEFITRRDYIPALGPAREFVESCASLNIGDITGPIKMQQSWVIAKLEDYKGIDESKFLKEEDEFKRNLLSRKKQEAFNRWFEKLQRQANLVSYTKKE